MLTSLGSKKLAGNQTFPLNFFLFKIFGGMSTPGGIANMVLPISFFSILLYSELTMALDHVNFFTDLKPKFSQCTAFARDLQY